MALNLRHLRFADHPQVPWRNGRGVTREIAVAQAAGDGPPPWRISMATISEAAAFSTFPGLDRSLAVVDGAGIELTVDGVGRVLGVGDEPARFAGDSPASAQPVAGSTLDLNLMVDPLCATGSITVALAGEHELSAGRWFVVALADGLGLAVENDETLLLDRLDAVTFEIGPRHLGCLFLAADQKSDDRAVAYLIHVCDRQHAPRRPAEAVSG